MANSVDRVTRLVGAAAAALVIASTAPGAGLAQAAIRTLTPGALTVCLYPAFPPAAYRDGGNWSGWDVDFMEAFAESETLTFEPVAIEEFDGMWRRPGEDMCDVAASGITRTPERQQTSPGTQWSDTYFTSERVFVVRSGDESKVRGIEDLAGRTVAVTKNTTGDLDLRRRMEAAGVADITIVYIDGDSVAAETVLGGDAFAFTTDETGADYLMSNNQGLASAWPHPTLGADGSESAEEFSFVVREASTGLADALNAYIAENGGQYDGNK